MYNGHIPTKMSTSNIMEPKSKYLKTAYLSNYTIQTRDQWPCSVTPAETQQNEKQSSTAWMQHYSVTGLSYQTIHIKQKWILRRYIGLVPH